MLWTFFLRPSICNCNFPATSPASSSCFPWNHFSHSAAWVSMKSFVIPAYSSTKERRSFSIAFFSLASQALNCSKSSSRPSMKSRISSVYSFTKAAWSFSIAFFSSANQALNCERNCEKSSSLNCEATNPHTESSALSSVMSAWVIATAPALT